MKVAILGAGRIGTVHAASIQQDPRSQLVAVCDLVAEAADALARAHGVEARSLNAVFADPAIDAVLIASSTNTHSELIELGVAAGKAVFCEKPVDLDLDRAREVLEITSRHDRPVMVGFNRRFDPNFARLKQLFEAGAVGKGEMLAVTSFDPAPPPIDYIEVSGGLFRDMMIHDFDMCAFLFGMPDTVTAHGSNLVDPAIGEAGDVDTAVVVLSYADGRLATIRNSRRAPYGYDQRVELLGAKGLLSVENETESRLSVATQAAVTIAKPVHFFLERYMRAYAIEWSAFVDAVVDGRPVPATVADGVNALVLAEAANRSLAEGRPVAVATITED